MIVKLFLTIPHGLLVCCCASVPLDWLDGCGCMRLVRIARKSLARVLTPIALDLSLSVSCNACCDAVRVLAAPSPSVCVWALLRAPPPIGL
eukprot:COSAG06_NODE_23211_length_699_cov_1.350000_2_plen_90_part_01